MTDKCTVVNLNRERYDVYIGRAGKGKDGYFGNPFVLQRGEARGATIERYQKWFYNRINEDAEFRRRVSELKGKKLGCFCKPNACHGDIIAEFVNNL
jgi:hypothetical protein